MGFLSSNQVTIPMFCHHIPYIVPNQRTVRFLGGQCGTVLKWPLTGKLSYSLPLFHKHSQTHTFTQRGRKKQTVTCNMRKDTLMYRPFVFLIIFSFADFFLLESNTSYSIATVSAIPTHFF